MLGSERTWVAGGACGGRRLPGGWGWSLHPLLLPPFTLMCVQENGGTSAERTTNLWSRLRRLVMSGIFTKAARIYAQLLEVGERDARKPPCRAQQGSRCRVGGDSVLGSLTDPPAPGRAARIPRCFRTPACIMLL